MISDCVLLMLVKKEKKINWLKIEVILNLNEIHFGQTPTITVAAITTTTATTTTTGATTISTTYNCQHSSISTLPNLLSQHYPY